MAIEWANQRHAEFTQHLSAQSWSQNPDTATAYTEFIFSSLGSIDTSGYNPAEIAAMRRVWFGAVLINDLLTLQDHPPQLDPTVQEVSGLAFRLVDRFPNEATVQRIFGDRDGGKPGHLRQGYEHLRASGILAVFADENMRARAQNLLSQVGTHNSLPEFFTITDLLGFMLTSIRHEGATFVGRSPTEQVAFLNYAIRSNIDLVARLFGVGAADDITLSQLVDLKRNLIEKYLPHVKRFMTEGEQTTPHAQSELAWLLYRITETYPNNSRLWLNQLFEEVHTSLDGTNAQYPHIGILIKRAVSLGMDTTKLSLKIRDAQQKLEKPPLYLKPIINKVTPTIGCYAFKLLQGASGAYGANLVNPFNPSTEDKQTTAAGLLMLLPLHNRSYRVDLDQVELGLAEFFQAATLLTPPNP